MSELSDIASHAGNLQTVANLAKTLLSFRNAGAIKGEAADKVVELQNAIMTTQTAYFTLLEEKRALETKMTEMEEWSSEAKRYALQNIDRGTFAYRFKEDGNSPEPTHWACPKCFKHKMISIMQEDHHSNGYYSLTCLECDSRLTVGEPPKLNFTNNVV